MPEPVLRSDITGRSFAEAGMNVKIERRSQILV
jgi:hypothetical protein